MQCDEMQPKQPDIDAEDLDAPTIGELTLDPSSIYEIQITQSGKTATVLYPEFHCSNFGYGWCGTGGCGFYIIVNGKAYYRQGGFRPQGVSFQGAYEPEQIIIYGIHGSGCGDAENNEAAGFQPCYSSAVWSEEQQTFFSNGSELTVWDGN
jgi:hypothetical protein